MDSQLNRFPIYFFHISCRTSKLIGTIKTSKLTSRQISQNSGLGEESHQGSELQKFTRRGGTQSTQKTQLENVLLIQCCFF